MDLLEREECLVELDRSLAAPQSRLVLVVRSRGQVAVARRLGVT